MRGSTPPTTSRIWEYRAEAVEGVGTATPRVSGPHHSTVFQLLALLDEGERLAHGYDRTSEEVVEEDPTAGVEAQ